jgi:putative redox protein
MPAMHTKVTFNDAMHFTGELDGHAIAIDADAAVGGQDLGPRPKGLVLTALAGCTAMDVISILRKMRLEPTSLQVEADAEIGDEHPKIFTRITLTYHLRGDLPREKVEKAVTLSQDRYCGVSAMLKQVVPIDWEIVIEP